MLPTALLTSLLVIHLTSAVIGTLTNGNGYLQQSFTNLLPGISCRILRVSYINYFNAFNTGGADFYYLLPTDIAAVWARRENIRGCSGVPIETSPGSGQWHYAAAGDERAVGASYVRLPTALPPDEKEVNRLTAEGMLGLVWGGRKWFAKGAEGIAGVGGGSSVGVKRRREVVSKGKGKGTAYIGARGGGAGRMWWWLMERSTWLMGRWSFRMRAWKARC
ncbi:MAG: hypothetical protein Q9184_004397 [Pyrenodesmia sp. 2 TL-2023]